MPYTRQDLINAFRAENPDAKDIPDNKIFAAIAQEDPELAQGISELAGVTRDPKTGAFVPPATPGTLAFFGANVPPGAPTPKPFTAWEQARRALDIAMNPAPAANTGPMVIEPFGLFRVPRVPLPSGVNRAMNIVEGALETGLTSPLTTEASIPEVIAGSPAGQLVQAVANVPGNVFDYLRSLAGSTKGATAKLDAIKAAAQDIAPNLGPAQTAAEGAEYVRATGGGTPPAPIQAFINRTTPPTAPPVLYPESFAFASNAKRLSALERAGTSPAMSSQLAQFANALQTANRDAAASVGMGDLFDQAMKEYRRAMTAREVGKFLLNRGIKFGLPGGAVGYGIYKELTR